jgi:arsenite/tail-anchored protein-transporting ATPase
MKVLFFTGKGGVGKSTLSSAAAWQLMEKGNKVLAVSFDPAHNLGDIFHLKLKHRKKRFKRTSLYLQETDMEKAAAEYINANMSVLKEVYSYLTTVNFDSYFDILKFSPGVEEYAALTSLERLIQEERNNFDYLVIDTPPTGLTLRILALPRITIAWLDRLIKIRKQILKKRYTIHNLSGEYDQKGTKLPYSEKDDKVIQKLFQMRAKYAALQAFLQGDRSKITVVFNPDYLSLKESLRLLEGIHELSLPISTIFNNKVSDKNREIAEGVEKDILKTYPALQVERVGLIDHVEPTCYIIEADITASL